MKYDILKIEPVNNFYLRSNDADEDGTHFWEKIYFFIFYKDLDGFDVDTDPGFISIFPVTDADIDVRYIDLEDTVGIGGTGVVIHQSRVPIDTLRELNANSAL
jgi:hypothetical protein